MFCNLVMLIILQHSVRSSSVLLYLHVYARDQRGLGRRASRVYVVITVIYGHKIYSLTMKDSAIQFTFYVRKRVFSPTQL